MKTITPILLASVALLALVQPERLGAEEAKIKPQVASLKAAFKNGPNTKPPTSAKFPLKNGEFKPDRNATLPLLRYAILDQAVNQESKMGWNEIFPWLMVPATDAENKAPAKTVEPPKSETVPDNTQVLSETHKVIEIKY